MEQLPSDDSPALRGSRGCSRMSWEASSSVLPLSFLCLRRDVGKGWASVGGSWVSLPLPLRGPPGLFPYELGSPLLRPLFG